MWNSHVLLLSVKFITAAAAILNFRKKKSYPRISVIFDIYYSRPIQSKFCMQILFTDG